MQTRNRNCSTSRNVQAQMVAAAIDVPFQAARRELERQRQLEWERQRKEQLMAEKHREQMYVDAMRTEVGKLKAELDTQVRIFGAGIHATWWVRG